MPSALRNGLVWLLLVLVPAGWIGLEALGVRDKAAAEAVGEAPPEALEQVEPEALGTITVLQGRVAALLQGEALKPDDPLGTRPLARLAAAMVLARAGERERALEQVQRAEDSGAHAPLVESVRAAVQAWPAQDASGVRAPAANALTPAQWTELDARMGWFAELARADLEGDPTARESVDEGFGGLLIALAVAGVWFLGAGLSGLTLLVVLGCLSFLGTIRSGIAPMPRVQSILGETFVAWMLLLLAVRVAAAWIAGGSGDPGVGELTLSLAVTFASLFALAWPIVRGMRWGELREAAGLEWNGGALRLCWMSASSYLCALPCMAAGIGVGLALSALMKDRSFQDVSHPVQEMLPSASGAKLLLLFLIACVAAPVVEEIAFRGLLYGHCRRATGAWPRVLSVAFAMLFSATVFAAIHPQGVLAVPALAGVSLGFCITREWSGSVVPGILAHGLHNGVVLGLNLVLQA